jgi:hypothetical protein
MKRVELWDDKRFPVCKECFMNTDQNKEIWNTVK